MNYNIKLKNISKKYGDNIILDNVDLHFDNNHIYVLIGKNGCGKSTLLNIISKYDTNYDGCYENNELTIGYLLQDDLLFRNLTVKENFTLQVKALYRGNNHEKINSMARKLGLLDFLNKKVSELSGGEKKKVAIGQIILTNADIILLDEPTANIQKEHAKDLLNIIYNEFKEKILIIASHDKCLVKVKLKNGKVHYGI